LLKRYSFAALVAAGLYGRFIESKWYEVTETDLPIPGLHPNFQHYRIVQISDLHLKNRNAGKRFDKIVQRINGLKPDVIVITGDFITHKLRPIAHELRTALQHLRAKEGIFAIPGNHDYQAIRQLRQIWRECGIIDLSNTCYTISCGEGQLHLAGVDDVVRRQARLDLVLQQLPTEGTAILLAHEPDIADLSAPTGRFSLQLSGHTHGGQIHLPYMGMIYAPKHGSRYRAGLYRIDRKMWLYVNRGFGTVTLPVRLNCRPEISLFRLYVPIRHKNLLKQSFIN